eukprot:854615-Amphidinium_carterae.1
MCIRDRTTSSGCLTRSLTMHGLSIGFGTIEWGSRWDFTVLLNWAATPIVRWGTTRQLLGVRRGLYAVAGKTAHRRRLVLVADSGFF